MDERKGAAVGQCRRVDGKDEDSAEALLKNHETLISDLKAFGSTVVALRDQAQAACHVRRYLEIISFRYTQ